MPHYSSSYRRPPPPLPDPATLPFPGNLIRLCTDCDLAKGCKAPVPGDGPPVADVMLVGEAPGFDESDWGYKPFVGKAGKELDSYLFQAGLSRESVYVTNVVHCRPPNNKLDPKYVPLCAKWLDLEIGLVNPSIIMALGATAIRRILGAGTDTVEHMHGRPVEAVVGGRQRIVLPAYHPAAALHQSNVRRATQEDFGVLRGLVAGAGVARYHISDEYPSPDYRVADTLAKLKQMYDEIHESGQYGVDTEWYKRNTALWSAQFSAYPGTGWFVPMWDGQNREVTNLHQHDATAILHYYHADVQWLSVPDKRFVDTLTWAYNLGLPRGLKELASRLCGIKMQNYSEVVRPAQRPLSIAYLTEAATRDWPDPPAIEEAKWDNKAGKVTVKVRKPWHISRKIKSILEDMEDPEVDPFKRWEDIEQAERDCVESVLGKMPQASLADIDRDAAILYAVRDADADLRVKLHLEKLMQADGLSFIGSLDVKVLPIAEDMMKNGMAVDVPYFKELSAYFAAGMDKAAVSAAEKVGHSFNPSSTLQVAKVVYGELGYTPTKKTKTGLISTDDEQLKKVNHPVIPDILSYRGLLKNKSTFADAAIENAIRDPVFGDRVHTTLKTVNTETGRWSSADPINLQTIPTRSEEGRKIRKGYLASQGYKMFAGDFCLAPGTKVLTKDMRWLPIESLQVGQDLVGVEEHHQPRTPRRMYPTKVVRVSSREAISYLILTADGCCLVASAEHPWLVRNSKNGGAGIRVYNWVNTDHLKVGDDLCKLVDTWSDDTSWGAGYLAGAFDGEGCLSNNRSSVLSFNQRTNLMLLKVLEESRKRGFKFGASSLDNRPGGFAGSKNVYSTWICSANEIMRFLGTTRPPRLLEKIGKTITGRVARTHPVKVVYVQPIGVQKVISLETTSHTFIAEGFVTHNSQQELRLQAHEANCKNMIALFLSGADFHADTASKIFGIPMDVAMQKRYRHPAKCFHPDTEVLTPDGWKRIVDLQLGIDKVMQAVPSDHGNVELEWVFPTEVFTTKHPLGKLIHLKNHGMDLRVTPDHRMLGWQHGKEKYRVVTPAEINNMAFWANAGMAGGILKVDERLLRLAVATEADGSFSWRKIRFGFYNERKINRIRELAGGQATESMCSNGKLRPVHYCILSRELSDEVRKLLDKDKTFPWWWLNLIPELRSVILDELPHWDGGTYPRWTQYVYSSGKAKSRDVVQALAAMTGRKSQQRSSRNISRGKLFTNTRVWVKNHALSQGGNLETTEEPYDGLVACLSVPSSFVLVRDKGTPVITGQTANFQIIYKVTAKGLCDRIHEQAMDIIVDGKPLDVSEWTEDSCARLIDEWYKLNWEVRDWQFEKIAFARRHGYVTDLFGRRRYVPEIFSPLRDIAESAERQIVNFPIQGGCASITKMAMQTAWETRDELFTPETVRFLLQIHDEIMLECKSEILMEAAKWLKNILDTTISLRVPMIGEVKAGPNWAEMKGLEIK